MRGPTILGVPIDSVGTAGGTELGPEREGTARSEGFEDAGDTSQQIRGLERDPRNGWLAFDDIVKMTARGAGPGRRIDRRRQGSGSPGWTWHSSPGRPGRSPGFTRGDRTGLLRWPPGPVHGGLTSPTGEGADLPVATTLGIAPDELLAELGSTPLVPPGRMVMIGARDEEERNHPALFPEGLNIGRIEYRDDLRHEDLAKVGQSIAAELAADGGRFWLHLDVDVLDREGFPATDYLMPDGLSIAELKALMAPAGNFGGSGRGRHHLFQPGEGSRRCRLRHGAGGPDADNPRRLSCPAATSG